MPTDSKFTIAYVDRTNLLGSGRMSAGYVWAHWPDADAPYTPSSSYQFNSKVPADSANRITRVSTGAYDVRLPLQAAVSATSATDGPATEGSWDGGNVQVSAYGVDTAQCQVGYWKNAEAENPETISARLVRVYCFRSEFTDLNRDGDTEDDGEAVDHPADSRFTMQYTAQMQWE